MTWGVGGHNAHVDPGVAMIPIVLVPYVQQSDAARVVFNVSVGAFVVGEISQALRVRRDSTRTDLGAEVLFRAMFFAGVLLFPTGRAVAPGATIGGGVWI